MRLLLTLLCWSLRTVLRSRADLALENLALRQQLATFARRDGKRPVLRPDEREFWVSLSRAWAAWRSCLLVVKPATVIAWHRRGYQRYWRWRSRKPGRPRIDAEHIAFIHRISLDHPEWGEDRIADELRGEAPRFLLHDNDGIFGQYRERQRRGHKRLRYRCRLDVWLSDALGIEGIPIPYGAPNANPHVERFHRALRQEALDHFIFVSERHVLRVCREYVRFYNGARPSQAIHAIPAPYPELREPPAKTGKLVALPVLGGIAHDYRRAA